MSMNFNNNKPTPPPATKPHNNNKLIAVIVIAVLLGTIGAVVIIHYVMSVQDNFDAAGIKFTKMNNGLLLSSGSESSVSKSTD